MAISKLWNYLSSEYFLLNALIIASYGLYRVQHQSTRIDIKAPSMGQTHTQFATLHSSDFPKLEAQVGATLLLTALARNYRSTSTGGRISTLLGYAQLFVLIITAVTDVVTSVLYLLGFGLVFLLCNEPTYTHDPNVEHLTPAILMEKCMKDTNDGVTYIVFLTTDWSSRCRHAYPLFVDLSGRYATEKLRFASLDVGVWPHVAKQLGVDITSVSTQLPTVIGFEAGKEFCRVPASEAATATSKKFTFSKMDLINALQLDSRFARSMDGAKAGTTKKKSQ